MNDASQWVKFEREVDKDIENINKTIFEMMNGKRIKTPRAPRKTAKNKSPRMRAISPNYMKSIPQKTIQMVIAEIRQACDEEPYVNYTKFPIRPNASARIWRPRSIPGLTLSPRNVSPIVTADTLRRSSTNPTSPASPRDQ